PLTCSLSLCRSTLRVLARCLSLRHPAPTELYTLSLHDALPISMLAGGASIAQVCQKLAVSEQTFHRWRHQYGGMKANVARRLKELELENTRLKRLIADQALDILILKEAARPN